MDLLYALFDQYWILGLGLMAQGFFGLRIFVQWWQSERLKKSTSSSLFWWLSITGSILFLIYGIIRGDLVIIVGQCISYMIYVKNIQLINFSKKSAVNTLVIILLPLLVLSWYSIFRDNVAFDLPVVSTINAFVLIGIGGQFMLNFRFIYQLYYAQKLRRSVLPTGFWVLSLAGSVLVILYAVVENEPVLVIAQGLAVIPYLRNIWLSRRVVEI